jgi:hypothetical protein
MTVARSTCAVRYRSPVRVVVMLSRVVVVMARPGAGVSRRGGDDDAVVTMMR